MLIGFPIGAAFAPKSVFSATKTTVLVATVMDDAVIAIETVVFLHVYE